jgi:valyl-tRNA synthetase
VTVATTRPETMLGDTAVAMNPSDPRATALVGKMVRLPIVGRLIPIIADEHVVLPNPESDDEKAKFSTGFLKVTPAHDPDDWAIGQRHDLPVINVMAPDGSINDKHGWEDSDSPEAQNLLGMDRFEAREAIVEWFRQENLLEDVRDYAHEVGHSYRSHVPIEPYLSDQWYIAVKKPIAHLAEKFGGGMIEGTDVPVNSLAGLALAPLLDGRLKFYPERYTKNYQNWLENLRDWPISRQLWWGHQIPVWIGPIEKLFGVTKESQTPDGGPDTKLFAIPTKINGVEVFFQTRTIEGQTFAYVCVPEGHLEIEQILENSGFVRDEDVLDTWFSSALWPFSTMGWPEENDTLGKFYPTDVLCTAREIITLWVSRMVMMGQYCVGDIPFSDVYIHAMIQDGQGRKMSKSLGNGIDPLVAIDSHGADAMRFTLASMTTDTQDVRMPVAELELPDGRRVNSSPKFDNGRNFCNKLWNASRFAMLNLEEMDTGAFDAAKLDITDKWIISRLNYTIKEVTKGLEDFKFHEPINLIARFFWNEFCDWYLEWIKPRMQDAEQKPIAQNVLAFVLDQILRLLHPFTPFITEGIFQNLNNIAPVRDIKGLCELNVPKALVVAEWPQELTFTEDEEYNQNAFISIFQNIVRNIREIRSQYNKPSEKLFASVNIAADDSDPRLNLLLKDKKLICLLANLNDIEVSNNIEKQEKAAVAQLDATMTLYVHDVIDPEEERKRLQKQKEFVEKGIRPLEAKLGNANFTSRAKPEVVEQSRQKLAELQEQLAAIEKHLAELK